MINNKYKLLENIGEGGFGNVYKAKNILNDNIVAVKLGKIDNNQDIVLKNEAKIYRLLKDISGIPKLRSYGTVENYMYIVMDYMDLSLSDLISIKKQLNVYTVASIGIQMINRLESIHKLNVIHRDIKPENILIKQDNSIVYLADFGLATMFIIDNKHITIKQSDNITGTNKYSSKNVKLGYNSSCRDDLESLFYVLIELYLGYIPIYITDTNTCDIHDIDNKYHESKLEHESIWDILKDCPGELLTACNYCRQLYFDEKPNYKYLKDLLNIWRDNITEDDKNIIEWL